MCTKSVYLASVSMKVLNVIAAEFVSKGTEIVIAVTVMMTCIIFLTGGVFPLLASATPLYHVRVVSVQRFLRVSMHVNAFRGWFLQGTALFRRVYSIQSKGSALELASVQIPANARLCMQETIVRCAQMTRRWWEGSVFLTHASIHLAWSAVVEASVLVSIPISIVLVTKIT